MTLPSTPAVSPAYSTRDPPTPTMHPNSIITTQIAVPGHQAPHAADFGCLRSLQVVSTKTTRGRMATGEGCNTPLHPLLVDIFSSIIDGTTVRSDPAEPAPLATPRAA